jgi:hypothetical protein
MAQKHVDPDLDSEHWFLYIKQNPTSQLTVPLSQTMIFLPLAAISEQAWSNQDLSLKGLDPQRKVNSYLKASTFSRTAWAKNGYLSQYFDHFFRVSFPVQLKRFTEFKKNYDVQRTLKLNVWQFNIYPQQGDDKGAYNQHLPPPYHDRLQLRQLG